ncbi:hypothetical protein ABT160_34275 [Streptomyces sp. NPDC001941]|uniref:hypothetical protein n=1 Tax=Streptomyces sp. NPDC001941 TaxID=3154659 RepID=UPI003316B0ED
MRFTKTSVALCAAATALLTAVAPAAVADDGPHYPATNPPATKCLPSLYDPATGQKNKPAGHYYDEAPDKGVAWWFFAQSGTGTLPFAPALIEELKRTGIKAEPICPVGTAGNGTAFWTPVGSDGYDNINLLNQRIWYPGGWKFTNPKTGRSVRTDGFWLHEVPLISKASANIYVDDKPVPRTLEMAHFSTFNVYLQLASPRLNQGRFTLGPTDWKFMLSEPYRKVLHDVLGINIPTDTHVISLEINASFLPDQNMPLKPGFKRD